MIALIFTLMLQATSGATASGQDVPAERVPPSWRQRPPADRFLETFPSEAWDRRQGGSARLRCRVRLDGTLNDCVVRSEEPEGMGFGAAALDMAPDVRMNPATEQGQPIDGAAVIVPFTWDASIARGEQPTRAMRQDAIRSLSSLDPEQAAFCAGLARAHAARDPSETRIQDAQVWSTFYAELSQATQSPAASEARLLRAQAEAEADGLSRDRLLDACRITISGSTYQLFDPRDALPENN